MLSTLQGDLHKSKIPVDLLVHIRVVCCSCYRSFDIFASYFTILLFRLLFASAFSHVLLSDSRYLYEKCTLLSVCLIRIVVGNRTKDIYT